MIALGNNAYVAGWHREAPRLMWLLPAATSCSCTMKKSSSPRTPSPRSGTATVNRDPARRPYMAPTNLRHSCILRKTVGRVTRTLCGACITMFRYVGAFHLRRELQADPFARATVQRALHRIRRRHPLWLAAPSFQLTLHGRLVARIDGGGKHVGRLGRFGRRAGGRGRRGDACR